MEVQGHKQAMVNLISSCQWSGNVQHNQTLSVFPYCYKAGGLEPYANS